MYPPRLVTTDYCRNSERSGQALQVLGDCDLRGGIEQRRSRDVESRVEQGRQHLIVRRLHRDRRHPGVRILRTDAVKVDRVPRRVSNGPFYQRCTRSERQLGYVRQEVLGVRELKHVGREHPVVTRVHAGQLVVPAELVTVISEDVTDPVRHQRVAREKNVASMSSVNWERQYPNWLW